MLKLTFDHVGALVSDLPVAIEHYCKLTNASASIIHRVESQQVTLAFVGEVELIQPDADTPLSNLMSKGAVFYHVAYRTNQFDATVVELMNMSYTMVNQAFESEAFEGRRCQFFRNPLGHLIEIVECL